MKELKNLPEYNKFFKNVFEGNDPINFKNILYAIASFERSILSNNSRFDQYAAGDGSALSVEERHGLNIFRSLKTRCFENSLSSF